MNIVYQHFPSNLSSLYNFVLYSVLNTQEVRVLKICGIGALPEVHQMWRLSEYLFSFIHVIVYA